MNPGRLFRGMKLQPLPLPPHLEAARAAQGRSCPFAPITVTDHAHDKIYLLSGADVPQGRRLARLAWEGALFVPPEWPIHRQVYLHMRGHAHDKHRIVYLRYGPLVFIFCVQHRYAGMTAPFLLTCLGPYPRKEPEP